MRYITAILASILITGCSSTPEITIEKTRKVGVHNITALYDAESGQFWKFKEHRINQIDFKLLHEKTISELTPYVNKGLCSSLSEEIQTYGLWGAKLSCLDNGTMFARYYDTNKSAYISGNKVYWGNAPDGRYSTSDMIEIYKIKSELKTLNYYQ